MFSGNKKKDRVEFVEKVQAARQQRSEGKERERAAIRIQVFIYRLLKIDIWSLRRNMLQKPHDHYLWVFKNF